MNLKELTELNGVSGNEDRVREYIEEQIRDLAHDIRIDSMGNIIAFKKGKNSRYKVMLSAHMDEVGFMITGFGESGVLKFNTVGGIDERILPGKRVLVGDKNIPGVIGSKPIHMQDRDERSTNVKLKKLYIDIGAEKKDEAEKLVSLGDYVAFHSPYTEFGDGLIKAKALDDRVGCAILIEVLKKSYEFDLYACFTVQEEVGLRGSEVVAYAVNPDIAIVVEGTTCSDVPEVEKYEYSTILGEGAAITIMDRTSYPNKGLVNYIYETAKKNQIPVQFKQTNSGGNDAGKIQMSRGGVVTASISVPCRYIHSPASVMSKKDFDSCKDIVIAVLEELGKNQQMFESFSKR